MRARSRGWLAAFIVYGCLLLISSLVRRNPQPTITPGPSDRMVTLQAVLHDRLLSQTVRLAYRDYMPEQPESAAVVVLIHGSPGHMGDFDRLGPLIGRRIRAIAPDLPGFGASSLNVPDYSFHAHAVYVRQLLDGLHITKAHLVGYSMGGGVALSFARQSPDRLASVTLLSAIGAQEMELTGDYYVNHVVHGAQLGGLWLLMEATPHMGTFDHAMLGVPYARNFFDSDQRPLRDVLRNLQPPTLIIHGRSDGLVPYEAALEHRRLVPQSELVSLDGDHFELFRKATELTDTITRFVSRVERGQATDRHHAETTRVAAALPLYGQPRFPRLRGIAASVVTSLVITISFVSMSFGAATAGALVAANRLVLTTALLAAFVGMFAVTVVGLIRHGVVRAAMFEGLPSTPRVLREETAERPILAHLFHTAVVSGVSVVIGLAVGTIVSWLLIQATAGWHNVYARATVVVASSALLVRVTPLAVTRKGRRLLLSSWRRLTRWEFWPPWVFYPPLFLYLVYLMVKYRSFTVFTAANPGIVAGGFVGESKIAILEALRSSPSFVARAHLVEASLSDAAKLQAAETFMSDEGLAYPIVLKPDNGQRGSGVVIVRSIDELRSRVRQLTIDTMIQEYIDGPEFGVFYYRYPGESHGHIFSITEKELPAVTGDGRRTLETLILEDQRAVCAARLYLDRHKPQLTRVPQDGERLALAELGTHCRGAMFLDGSSLLTRELERTFDEIAHGFDGFFFGRFDVRATGGITEFRQGRGFKIIELNGVTSEATHIYDPATSLLAAYRVLMRQWNIAFAIGDENHKRGYAPASAQQLFRLMHEYRQTALCHLAE